MSQYHLGQVFKFGPYSWRVLRIEDEKVLLVTDKIIDHRSYHDQYVPITWADSSLRAYLNSDFIDQFTKEDQKRIIEVDVKNLDNQWHGSEGGKATRDKVFLLSIEEVACLYFGDSSDRLYSPGKNQKYWLQRKDKNNVNRIANIKDSDEYVWWWWLRSPGRYNVRAAYIHGDGNIGIQGNNVLLGNRSDGRCTGGVRPAMWLTLK